jgi:hypothetical protein
VANDDNPFKFPWEGEANKATDALRPGAGSPFAKSFEEPGPAEALNKLAASASVGRAAYEALQRHQSRPSKIPNAPPPAPSMSETSSVYRSDHDPSLREAITKVVDAMEPSPPEKPPTAQPSHGGDTTDSSPFNNIIVVVASELIALPFCFNGADGFMSNDWLKTAKGFGIGLPIGIAGLTFPLWRKYLKRPTQEWVQNDAKKWWPIALLLTFIYVLGPDIYNRIQVAAPPASVPGFTQQQVDEKVANAVANLNSQLTEANRQRDAAQRETNALRQQIQNAPPPQAPDPNAPRVYSEKTVQTLRDSCADRTPLQCDVLISDEKVKWIKATGRAGDIRATGQVVIVVGTAPEYAVFCTFNNALWRLKLVALRERDPISVVGKISGYNGAMLILSECELQ